MCIRDSVHTERPGDALNAALNYGEIIATKIENMKEQNRNLTKSNKEEDSEIMEEKEPIEDFGFVCVCAGSGIKELFYDLGASNIVSGGQTMNPSTDDLVAAVKATPAKTVYILPNNKNIILAANQTVPIVKDRKVIVIPTRTIPQGIAAMLAFDPENEDAILIAKSMEAACRQVKTGQVTFAARDSEFGGFRIKKGDLLGLSDGKLTYTGHDPVKVASRLINSMKSKKTSFVTIIYGEGITEEQAIDCKNFIKRKLGHGTEINIVNGKQPIYSFIIAVE
eukprot:TRINITY_DN6288_c0_g1_i11.p1 TRINITY_DN6288_c0_g1~~TRINITY_DN6288_c0_g1_i11.p1  ORF type:complete len:280 (-),score=-14.76 TRINITY_DN6288_c0_g1_i11:23-862(-)